MDVFKECESHVIVFLAMCHPFDLSHTFADRVVTLVTDEQVTRSLLWYLKLIV